MQVKQFSHRKICVKRNKGELIKTILRSHEADKGRPAGHVDWRVGLNLQKTNNVKNRNKMESFIIVVNGQRGGLKTYDIYSKQQNCQRRL